MRFIESRTRFGDWPAMYFAMLVAVMVLLAVLLLAFPGKALAAADLKITKEGPSPSRVEPGTQFEYVLTVSNAGEDPATGVTVEDELPDGVTLVESEPNTCGPINGSNVTCTPFNLEAGKSKTITLKVRAPLSAGVIENRATASSADDPDSPVASNEVTITVAPILVIEKQGDPEPVETEDILLYTLRVENQGDTDATNVTIRDELPLDVIDFVSVDSNDLDCEYKAGIVKCETGLLESGDIVKVTIAVEPEKAGTIKNTGAVFVDGVREPLDTDTESTVVKGGSNPGPGPGPGPEPTNPGDDVPKGDQCSPVVERGTDKTVGVLSGTTPQAGIFTNTFNAPLPLRIAYATSSEDGSLNITVTPKDGGKAVLDKTIQGKKKGVIEVETKAGVSYDVLFTPENQGFAVKLQIGKGDEPCADPNDLEPPAVPGGGDNDTNGTNGTNGTRADDVIDDTISDRPLPNTGGPPLLGLAAIALGLAVSGACVAGVRRRDG